MAVWTANIFPIFREPGLIYSDFIRGWLPNRKFLHCDWRILTSASVKNEPSILDEGLYHDEEMLVYDEDEEEGSRGVVRSI